MTRKQVEDKIIEIIGIAKKLNWISVMENGYRVMTIADIEKCLYMALDESELIRFKEAPAWLVAVNNMSESEKDELLVSLGLRGEMIKTHSRQEYRHAK